VIKGFGYTSSCIEPPDMPSHIAYRPSYHGHYYFKPYHHSHVIRHRESAERVGDDPRNPYANRIFEQFYRSAEMKRKESGSTE
jgi:hypothetical protein